MSDRHMEILTDSPEETQRVGRRIGELINKGAFIGLSGELGTGKTVLARGIARGLGIDDSVTSPTFQLVREYEGRERLFHFDFYRLGSEGEAVDLDIEYCLEAGVVVVEWSDRFPGHTSLNRIDVNIIRTGDESRRLVFKAEGGAGNGLVELMSNLEKLE